MQSFVDLDRLLSHVPGAVVTRLGASTSVAVARSSSATRSRCCSASSRPARVAGITASSALEGVVVADQARAAAIIGGRAAVLHTRSEQELAGYRAALDHLFTGDWRPLNLGLLLHLHRELFALRMRRAARS